MSNVYVVKASVFMVHALSLAKVCRPVGVLPDVPGVGKPRSGTEKGKTHYDTVRMVSNAVSHHCVGCIQSAIHCKVLRVCERNGCLTSSECVEADGSVRIRFSRLDHIPPVTVLIT